MTRHPDTRLVPSETDRAFDRLLPEHLRRLSHEHWTPVDVAIRATALLCPASGTRILDIGSGVGKPCVIGTMPPSYERVYHERMSAVGLNLALWVHRAASHGPTEPA